VHTPRIHSLVSTLTPVPQEAVQVPMTHSPYTTQVTPLSQGIVLRRGSVQMPDMHSLVSTLTPVPQEAVQYPIFQLLYTTQAGMLQAVDLVMAPVQSP